MSRRLFVVVMCLIALAPSLIACTRQDPGQQPADIDAYLEDIRAEATRTALLNDRTEALLDQNEVLSATATAAYAEFNESQEPLRLLAQDLAFLLDAVNELLSQAPAAGACEQLTVTRLDGIEGVDPTLAQRIRAEFGCAVLQ